MDTKENKPRLFSEFPPVSTAEWEEKIKADLKGADYEKRLIWKTDEGFPVKPYYRQEDLDGLAYLESLPGEAPFTRGTRKNNNRWTIRQDIFTEDIKDANRIALDAIRRGADAVGFRVREITTHKQMSHLLSGIDLTKTSIHFTASKSYPLTLELFLYEIDQQKLDGRSIHGSLNFDPNSYCLIHGECYKSEENNLDEAEYLINTVGKKLPRFRVITLNGNLFSNAGATTVQELAFSLASANEYLDRLTEKGILVDEIVSRMVFSFGIGSNYFMEIAKLRAARILWATLVGQYKPKSAEAEKMFIHSTTSRWNKTIYDPYVNMLRTTTESMSAILGNADSVTVLPFDMIYSKENEFSTRVARNQQLILKNEAYLDKVADPSAGAYYLENLTHSIATHAWEKFLSVLEQGGFLECIKKDTIQDEIAETAKKKETDIAQRKTVVLGTSQYPNLNENMLREISTDLAPGTDTPAKFRKIKVSRGAAAFEKIRLATEKFVMKGNPKPSVFLFQYGNLAMRKARAAFATNFFGCAGYEIIDNAGFENLNDGILEVKETGPKMIVLCSSDEEYATLAGSLAGKIKKECPKAVIIVAGYPKDILESLKAAGVDDFIHIRSNVLEVLEKYQKQFGIL